MMGKPEYQRLLFLLAQRFTRENWTLCFPSSEELGLTPERLKVLKWEGRFLPLTKGWLHVWGRSILHH